MASVTGTTELTGLFKEVYADDIIQLIPDIVKLTKMVPFVSKEKQAGGKYHQPVLVATEHGVTYAAADSGAFALASPVALKMQDAQLLGNQMLLRSVMSYDAAARSAKGKQAFAEGTSFMVEAMLESISRRLETSLLYGGSGLGVISSVATVDSTHSTVSISAASWAPGLWAGMENALVDLYNSGGTIVNSGDVGISAVDFANKTLTIVYGADKTAIDAITSGNIFFKGSKANEMKGLDLIAQNTGSLFNIDAAVYNVWKGNSFAVGGQLTMSKVLSAIAKLCGRGLAEDIILMVSPATWANLATDLAAQRKFDGSYSRQKGQNGVESIEYYSQNGLTKIVSHAMVKEGEGFIFPEKSLKRVGAREISFKSPGNEDDIFLQAPDKAGFELRVYCDQALFCDAIAKCLKFTGIVNV